MAPFHSMNLADPRELRVHVHLSERYTSSLSKHDRLNEVALYANKYYTAQPMIRNNSMQLTFQSQFNGIDYGQMDDFSPSAGGTGKG